MPIVWKPDMSVGHPLIDDEHKQLICLINSVEIALKADKHLNIIRFLVQQLQEYTHYHFDQEERLMIENKYAGYQDHKMAHQRILESIAELKGRLKSISEPEEAVDLKDFELPDQMEAISGKPDDKPAPDNESEIETDIVRVLRAWIIDHVLNEDMKLKPLFRKPAH